MTSVPSITSVSSPTNVLGPPLVVRPSTAVLRPEQDCSTSSPGSASGTRTGFGGRQRNVLTFSALLTPRSHA